MSCSCKAGLDHTTNLHRHHACCLAFAAAQVCDCLQLRRMHGRTFPWGWTLVFWTCWVTALLSTPPLLSVKKMVSVSTPRVCNVPVALHTACRLRQDLIAHHSTYPPIHMYSLQLAILYAASSHCFKCDSCRPSVIAHCFMSPERFL